MAGNIISGDELAQFRSISVKKKVDSMELYLIGKNGYRYNMQEVGEYVFGDENYSFTVSLIHRCYNFSGQNGGRYKNGCRFEQAYGYRVSRRDIEAFVRQYPNGTFNNGVTFDSFLMSCVKRSSAPRQHNVSRPAPAPYKPAQQVYRQSVPRQSVQRQPIQTQKVQRIVKEPRNPRRTDANYSNNQVNYDKIKGLMIGIGSILALVVLIMIVTGYFFRHFTTGLIIALITGIIFAALKEM